MHQFAGGGAQTMLKTTRIPHGNLVLIGRRCPVITGRACCRYWICRIQACGDRATSGHEKTVRAPVVRVGKIGLPHRLKCGHGLVRRTPQPRHTLSSHLDDAMCGHWAATGWYGPRKMGGDACRPGRGRCSSFAGGASLEWQLGPSLAGRGRHHHDIPLSESSTLAPRASIKARTCRRRNR